MRAAAPLASASPRRGEPARRRRSRGGGGRLLSVRAAEPAADFLFSRSAAGIKWGLDTTRALLEALGSPEREYATVHVGGTNGKGSTAAMLAAAAQAAGRRVGLYTSPHLVSFRERIRVGGKAISSAALEAWVARLEPVIVERGASFFEAVTAVAFAEFAACGVDLAVVEVGLGGRLDATNVIRPLAAGVTRIALEHTEYLGTSKEAIAREKAGIAKSGVPFVTTEPEAALARVLLEEARRRGAGPLAEWLEPAKAISSVRAERDGTRFDLLTPAAEYRGLTVRLLGAHQAANAALAVRLAEWLGRLPPAGIGAEAIRRGLLAARLPGRYDCRAGWLFDVAHNPDGALTLVDALRAVPPPGPVVAVVAVLADKAWREMLAILAPAVDGLIATAAPSAPSGRAWDLELVASWARAAGVALEVEADFERALRVARDRAATVLVTGSFHTVGDAMDRLPGMAPIE